MKNLFKSMWQGARIEKTWKRLSIAAVMLVALGMIPVAYASHADLAGYWAFDEGSGQVAGDSSGHANAGQLGSTSSADANDPVWITDGISGTPALSFDGSDDFVVVADSADLESPTISVEVWVRFNSFPGDFRYILAKGANACEAASYGLYTGGSGGLIFYIYDGTGLNYTASPDAGSGVWDGAWHHVLGTFDGSTVRLYVDDVEIGSGTLSTFSIGYGLPTTDDLYIGTYQDQGTCGDVNLHFPGDIDGVRVWTRAMLPSEINNHPPTADANGPYLGATDSAIAFDGTGSSDPDDDALTYDWDWGDTSSSADVGDTPTHTYSAAGIYDVCLTVTDLGGLSDTACTIAVVYDPSAGFVTGGGWIDSPAGACPVFCGDATGKASFGFVSKYKKGQSTPDGNTQFQFNAGNLNFRSDSYQWLVVAGSDAKFKGDGTINGVGNYGFMLTGFDADVNTKDSQELDGFRIVIWDKDKADDVVYDNLRSLDIVEDDYGTQPLGSGSIVIHSKKGK